MNDQQRAERRSKQEERARDGRQAMIEYEVQARATREKTERLKALRLAKEARAQTQEPPAEPTKRRPRLATTIALCQAQLKLQPNLLRSHSVRSAGA